MATEQISPSPSATADTQVASHPLSPLTASEIVTGAKLIRGLYPTQTKIHFKAITLEEPEKAQLVPYLDAEHNGRPLPRIPRKAFVNYYIRNTVSLALRYAHTPGGYHLLVLDMQSMSLMPGTNTCTCRINSMRPSSISH